MNFLVENMQQRIAFAEKAFLNIHHAIVFETSSKYPNGNKSLDPSAAQTK